MKINKQIPDSYKNQTLEKIEQIENELDTVNDSLIELNSNLTNEDSEQFIFGVKDGVRGFFTDPSRADDCFIPFSSECQYELSKYEGYLGVNNATFSFPTEIGSHYLVIVSCSAVNNGGWSNEQYSFTNASNVKQIFLEQKIYKDHNAKYFGFCVFEVTADATTVSFSKSFGYHLVQAIAFKITQ